MSDPTPPFDFLHQLQADPAKLFGGDPSKQLEAAKALLAQMKAPGPVPPEEHIVALEAWIKQKSPVDLRGILRDPLSTQSLPKHQNLLPPLKPLPPSTPAPYNHGSNCSGCGHNHPTPVDPHAASLPKSKSKIGWIIAGIVAAVGVGAYLINEYGKPKDDSWANKVTPPDNMPETSKGRA